jgi:hypothetical protein
LSKEELCDGREENETSLKDVRVEKTDVGTSFGFAQFLQKQTRPVFNGFHVLGT